MCYACGGVFSPLIVLSCFYLCVPVNKEYVSYISSVKFGWFLFNWQLSPSQ